MREVRYVDATNDLISIVTARTFYRWVQRQRPSGKKPTKPGRPRSLGEAFWIGGKLTFYRWAQRQRPRLVPAEDPYLCTEFPS